MYCLQIAMQQSLKIQNVFSPVTEQRYKNIPPFAGNSFHSNVKQSSIEVSSICSCRLSNSLKVPVQHQVGGYSSKVRASRTVETFGSGDGHKRRRGESSDTDEDDDDDVSARKGMKNDPYVMDAEERREWRRTIRDVMKKYPEIDEGLDAEEKKTKMQKLMDDYPLVVEEEDPDWPEDADGWGFNLGQFFDKITIKNVKKDEDENYDSENEIVWQDDNYIRPIKDIKTEEWEEAVFKDISPLIILVHNRYKRPKENEKIRDELEKAVNIIWNCRLPSPRCVAIDAVTETDLVSVLRVSSFPEIIFTKAGKILYREKVIRTADEFSKIMAYFYYGAAKPPCLKDMEDSKELIPSSPVSS